MAKIRKNGVAASAVGFPGFPTTSLMVEPQSAGSVGEPLNWADFRRKDYVAAIAETSRALSKTVAAVVRDAGPKPKPPGPMSQALDDAIYEILLLIDTLSNCFEFPEDRARNLALFFPTGTAVSKNAVAPKELVAEMFLELFRESFSTLRTILISFAMPGLRREWGAFHPLLVDNAARA